MRRGENIWEERDHDLIMKADSGEYKKGRDREREREREREKGKG